MHIIDLTHNIEEGMPVYPGTEPPQIKTATTISKHGFEERLLTMFSHTGTHMDAPCHILKGKMSLSDYGIADFTGKAVLIDVRGLKDISTQHVAKYTDKLREADFAVLYSGWDKYWRSDEYFKGYPVLTREATEFLATLNLKGICMDMISIDKPDTETYDNHKVVFHMNILVVENLMNLHLIDSETFTISCIPLKIKSGDGAPVRAFATIEV